MNPRTPDFFYGGPIFFADGMREQLYRTIYDQITGEMRARYEENGEQKLADFLAKKGAPELSKRKGGLIQRTFSPEDLNLGEYEDYYTRAASPWDIKEGLRLVLDLKNRRKKKFNRAHFSPSSPPRIRFYLRHCGMFGCGGSPGPDSIESLKEMFKRMRFHFTKTLTHEASHYVDWITGYRYFRTSPYDMEYNHDYRRRHGHDPRHEVQGSEYYPRVMDELQRLHNEVENFGPVPRSALRVYLGLEPEPDEQNSYGDPRSNMLREYFFSEDERWRSLRWKTGDFFDWNKRLKHRDWKHAASIIIREAEKNGWMTSLGSPFADFLSRAA